MPTLTLRRSSETEPRHGAVFLFTSVKSLEIGARFRFETVATSGAQVPWSLEKSHDEEKEHPGPYTWRFTPVGSGCRFIRRKDIPMPKLDSATSLTPPAADLTVNTALLQFAMQLHHARGTADVLDGRTLALDDDVYLLKPNPGRDLSPFAVIAEFPQGVEIAVVFDTLGFPFGHPGLEKAVAIFAAAKQEFEAARAEAQRLLEEFVAEMAAQPSPSPPEGL
jgi:hypothetical protein